ncbi:hypothetical protein B0H11DRAFT_2049189 [Mycena galericulata]|nr:hypothetical protein B0H11DRAFT_2049189 [Mycena galericulata]
MLISLISTVQCAGGLGGGILENVAYRRRRDTIHTILILAGGRRRRRHHNHRYDDLSVPQRPGPPLNSGHHQGPRDLDNRDEYFFRPRCKFRIELFLGSDISYVAALLCTPVHLRADFQVPTMLPVLDSFTRDIRQQSPRHAQHPGHRVQQVGPRERGMGHHSRLHSVRSRVWLLGQADGPDTLDAQRHTGVFRCEQFCADTGGRSVALERPTVSCASRGSP